MPSVLIIIVIIAFGSIPDLANKVSFVAVIKLRLQIIDCHSDLSILDVVPMSSGSIPHDIFPRFCPNCLQCNLSIPSPSPGLIMGNSSKILVKLL